MDNEEYQLPREVVMGVALMMYAGEPCRICLHEITADDVSTAVFAGYSEDNSSRAAHKGCFDRMLDIVRQNLDAVLEAVR